MSAFDPHRLVALPPRVTVRAHTARDTILYALGLGAGQNGEAEDLHLVYEQDLAALPTMAVVLATPGFWLKEPEHGIDWKRILHAEQSITIARPLPAEGEIRNEMTVDWVVDKGAAKGALLSSTRRLYDTASGDLLATVTNVSFLRGNGGQGGTAEAAPAPHPVPDRPADHVVDVPTRREQALLYRLSGDFNPLHADPEVARQAGQPRPILHGLCTYGIAGRILIGALCGNDPARLTRLDCRFTAPVLPGEELRVSIWREGDGRAAYRVEVPARGVVAINNGYAEYLD